MKLGYYHRALITALQWSAKVSIVLTRANYIALAVNQRVLARLQAEINQQVSQQPQAQNEYDNLSREEQLGRN
jgi:hypothetical protein